MITIDQALNDLSLSLEGYFYMMTTLGLTVAPVADIKPDVIAPDVLLFQYKIVDIFSDVKMLSANLGKYAQVTENQADLFDQITITEEDKPMFDRFLKGAALYVYGKIQGLSKLATSNFMYDEGVTIKPYVELAVNLKGEYVLKNLIIYKALADVSTDPAIDLVNWLKMPDYVDTKGKITIFILNNPDFDPTALRVWDDIMKDLLAICVMEKIFKFRVLPLIFQDTMTAERVAKEGELNRSLSSRKNPVRRPVGWL